MSGTAIFGQQSRNYKISPSTGLYTATGGAAADIPNLTVTMTCSGLTPIFISFVAEAGSGATTAGWGSDALATNTGNLIIGITCQRDGVTIAQSNIQQGLSPSQIHRFQVGPSTVSFVDESPPVGNNVYKIRASSSPGTSRLLVTSLRMFAFEL